MDVDEEFQAKILELNEDHWSRRLAREDLTAEQALTPRQVWGFVALIAFFIVLSVLQVMGVILMIFAIITIVYLVSLVFQTTMVTQSGGTGLIRVTPEEITELQLHPEHMKSITILVPFFKETERVIVQVIKALNPERLQYPAHLLNIWMLGEQDDHETFALVKRMQERGELPDYIEVIWYPHSIPQTKPKVCQETLKFINTDLVGIYDIEDKPEWDQILKQVVAWNNVWDENIACIQGRLAFRNASTNILTRLFAGEYDTYFGLVLPGLAKLGLPVPLGGTSNFFRVDILKQVGGWDPWNVTEDTHLGIILARMGYRTMLLETVTWEEATSKTSTWINQRSRWLLGRIVTYLVNMRHPVRLFRNLGPVGFMSFQITIGIGPLTLLLNPIFWVLSCFYMMARFVPWEQVSHGIVQLGTTPYLLTGDPRIAMGILVIGMVALWTTVTPVLGVLYVLAQLPWPTIVDGIEQLYPTPVLYAGNICLVLGNFLFIMYVLLGTLKRAEDYDDEDSFGNIPWMLLSPFYWALMSIACWKGFIQLLRKKHSVWKKTPRDAAILEQMPGNPAGGGIQLTANNAVSTIE